MRRVHLVRHGSVVGDGAHRYLGHTDLPMSEAGVAEIEALAAAYAEVPPFDVVWCSDLARSRRTAEILAARHGVQIRTDPRLREIDMGDWEGLDRAAFAAAHPEVHAARGRDLFRFRPPGGESFADLLARIQPVWRMLEDMPTDAQIAIAGHAGVHRLMICHVLGMPPENLFRLAKTSGRVDLVEWRPDGPVLRLLDAGPGAIGDWRRGVFGESLHRSRESPREPVSSPAHRPTRSKRDVSVSDHGQSSSDLPKAGKRQDL